MKRKRSPKTSRRFRLPRRGAGYEELDRFFSRHTGTELVERGIMEIDRDRRDLKGMLRREARSV